MKQSRYLGFLLAMPGLLLGLQAAAPPGRVHLPTGQHQLFLDDYLVGSLYRVKRRVNQPVKYEGNPVVFAEKPWEKHPGPDWNPAETQAIQIRSAPCWDPQEQVWKIWYYSGSRTLFARSKDGITWEKPSLGKRELEGSKDNNLILVKGTPRPSSSMFCWIRTAPQSGDTRVSSAPGTVTQWSRPMGMYSQSWMFH